MHKYLLKKEGSVTLNSRIVERFLGHTLALHKFCFNKYITYYKGHLESIDCLWLKASKKS